tara:strand:+ start:715 stop:927 length:213 start_codon:yes stop_codon:yes gene_type:complete
MKKPDRQGVEREVGEHLLQMAKVDRFEKGCLEFTNEDDFFKAIKKLTDMNVEFRAEQDDGYIIFTFNQNN